MSGIVGIFNRDGRPVDRELFARTLESISHRGPDGNDQWVNRNIALGHQMMWTTPEAHYETQPLVDENKHFCLVMDGRVDNRTEVKKALADAGFAVRKDTDADIMLRAYECWGESFPFRIIGDFAVAIWDARKRHLFCTRDVFGVKPFYYGLHGNSFIFSSEIRSFFADPTFPVKVNEGMVGEILSDSITSKVETLYQHLFRLPPAHSMVINFNGIRKVRYWDFDPTKTINYRTDAEYAEHFLELFMEVLTQHMRSDRPMGADLSGGLDSSAIVGTAHSLFKKGLLLQNDFETFSLIFPEHKEADERVYIEDVVRMWNIKSNQLAPARDSSIYAKSVEQSRYLPSAPNGHMMDSMRIAARGKGMRVMLTGIGGDEFLNGSFLYFTDLIKGGRLFTALKEVRSIQPNYLLAPYSLLRYGLFPLIRPLIPEYILQMRKRIQEGNRNYLPFKTLSPEFVERTNLRERLRGEAKSAPFPTLTQNATYQMMQNGWFSFRFEIVERDDAWHGIEYRFPFYDRRMAEFCLALPGEQKMRGGKSKFILRQAMKNILPKSILQRIDKGDFTFTTAQCFEDLKGECLDDSYAIGERGWISSAQVQNMYKEMMHFYHSGASYPVWPLWMIFSVELWLRIVFSKYHKAISINTFNHQSAGS